MQNHVLQKDKYATNVGNNHFAKICLKQVPTQQHSYRPQQRQQLHVNQVTSEPVDPDSSSDDEYLYVLSQDAYISRIPTMSVMISEIPVDMIIDTGPVSTFWMK